MASKLKLLLFKNWRVQLRHKFRLVFEFLIAILICVFIGSLRKAYNKREVPKIYFESFNTSCRDSYFISTLDVKYFPANHTELNRLVRNVFSDYSANKSFEGFSDRRDMEEKLEKSSDPIGLEFDGFITGSSELPKHLKTSIRLLTYDYYNKWNTDQIIRYSTLTTYEKMYSDFSDIHGSSSYYEQCFLFIQENIARQFVEKFSNAEIPNINLQRFSEPAHIEDTRFYINMTNYLTIFINIHFYFVIFNLVREISKERERNFTSYLEGHGFDKMTQWQAWFLKFVTICLIYSLIFAVLLKRNFTSCSKFGVFCQSNLFLIWVYFMFCYIVVILYSFVLSRFISKSRISAYVAVALWTFMYIPYYISVNIENNYWMKTTPGINLILSFLPSSAISFGFFNILCLEWNQGGLHWSNLFTKLDDHGLSVGDATFSMVFGVTFCFFLLIYCEISHPEHSKRKSLAQIIQGIINRATGGKYYVNLDSENNVEPEETSTRLSTVEIIGLTKLFKRKKHVIDDISVKFYDQELTVLLGTGKSTLINLIIGISNPTYGQIIKYSKYLGFSPQSDVFINDLTVAEYFNLFCQAKGMTSVEAKRDTEKYARKLELKQNSMVRDLTKESRKVLSVALAFAGNSTIVLLDEPMSGLSQFDKNNVRSLISAEKKSRTIIVATNSVADAEILADRIIVLKNGKVVIDDIPYELKENYGIGYQITCIKDRNFNAEKMINQITKDLKIKSDNTNEIIYTIDKSYLSIFPEILEFLEKQKAKLGISEFSVNTTRLEDVIFDTPESSSNVDSQKFSYERIVQDAEEITIESFDGADVTQTSPSYCTQTWGVILRKFYFLGHYRNFFAVNVLITILFIIVAIVLVDYDLSIVAEFPSLEISLANYTNTRIYVKSDGSEIANTYIKLIEKSQNVTFVPPDADMDDFVLKSNGNYAVGAEFNGSNITGFFNDNYFHSLPLALDLLLKSIVRQQLGPDYEITFINKPFVTKNKPYWWDNDDADIMLVYAEIYNRETIVIFFYWAAQFLTYHVKERTTGSKSMLLKGGLSKLIYWATSLIFDTLQFAVLEIIFTAIYILTTHATTAGLLFLFEYSFTISLAFFHAASFMYLFSLIFRKTTTAKIVSTLASIAVGFPSNYFVVTYLSPGLTLMDLLFKAKSILLPRPLMIFVSMGLFNFGLLMLVEYEVFNHLYRRIFCFGAEHRMKNLLLRTFASKQTSSSRVEADPEVKTESEMVNSMSPNEVAGHPIILKNVSRKNYNSKEKSFEGLSVIAERSTFLGIIASKKSIRKYIFNAIIGNKTSYFGDIYIFGKSIKEHSHEITPKIGICAEEPNIQKFLTGRQNLRTYGLIKGLTRFSVNSEIADLNQKLKLDDILDKSVKVYSEGDRKILGIAMALIGKPHLIVLDEPFTDLNVEAKQLVCSYLEERRRQGTTIIITSCNFIEYQDICNKSAILLNGILRHLGSPQAIKDKFVGKIIVRFKYTIHENDPSVENVEEIKSLIQRTIPELILRHETSKEISYTVNKNYVIWSQLFKNLEHLKTFQNIESYIVTEYRFQM